MKFLLNIPLVMYLANWVWGEDPSDLVSPFGCVEAFPLMVVGCWTRLVVKGLGIGIILGSCLNKAPIIRNIIDSQSSEGLSNLAVYGEAVVYANCAFYGWLESHPLSNYGENVSMLLQNLIIIALAWKYTPVAPEERLLVMSFALGYLIAVTRLLTEEWHYLLMASVWPIMLASRGSQVLQTYRLKHTGANSVITLAMSLFGACIRILTTLKEVGLDIHVIGGFLLSVGLNSVLFGQYFWYRANTTKFLHDLKAKKKEE